MADTRAGICEVQISAPYARLVRFGERKVVTVLERLARYAPGRLGCH